jgi:alpha-galactosidase
MTAASVTVASPPAELVQLRAAGTALVLDVAGPALPRVVHWGSDLGDLHALDGAGALLAAGAQNSSTDQPRPLTLLPGELEAWSGTPGFAGHRAGADAVPRWRLTGPVDVEDDPAGGGAVRVRAADEACGLEVSVHLALDPHGLLGVETALTSTADGTYDVAALRALLPLPPVATEVLDLTGRWLRERSPQRSPLLHGTRTRASRRGRPGHDATLLLAAGTPGFGFRTGEVWAVHVAWSGDHEHLVERLPEGAGGHAAVLGGGELLRAGEVRLAAGETYTAPPVVFAHAEDGLDGISARFHRHLRARPHHPPAPRPVVLNTWEAVYFDHDLPRLRHLADVAASIGVERFVLDDGWFRGRRDDSAGLGDWFVDERVWPDGLHPLVDHVRGLGMQVGLWVEPEMVNPDSELAREHPDWLLTPGAPLWRSQQVLDVAHPRAHAFLLDRLDAIVGEHHLDFLKWDHNRDLHAALHGGRPGVRAQTLAVYRLLDELRRRHPGLEVESCASGGARVDLGILQRTDRVWASDCNDAVERQEIQRWTTLLLPPELVGTHVGPATSHTTGRVGDLAFRCATALFGHAGLECDVGAASAEEVRQLAAWVALHRELRPLLHGGDVVRADAPDDGARLHGVVAADRSEAVFSYVRVETSPDAAPGRVRLPGLDPDRRYRVRRRDTPPAALGPQAAAPGWLDEEPVVRGAVLGRAGLPMPVLAPATAVVLHLTPA